MTNSVAVGQQIRVIVPRIRHELFGFRIDDAVGANLVEEVTDVMHENMRDHAFAFVDGPSPKNWQSVVAPGRLMRWRSEMNRRSMVGEIWRGSATARIEED